jgi:transmembrane sensor
MDSEAIEEVAARWLVRRHSGRWTEADQAQLDMWLSQSTANRVSYIRLEAAWEHSARLKALGAGIPPGVIPDRGSWGYPRFFFRRGNEGKGRDPVRRARTKFRPAVAVGLLVVVAIAVGSYVLKVDSVHGDRYSTPVGGLQTIPLADGSRITLNTDTQIRIALSATEREINLDRGEAYFIVAKDRSRPFVVEAGNKRVTAVGTRFSVRREADDVQVVVTEGTVRLTPSNGSLPQIPTAVSAGAVAQTLKGEVLVRENAAPEAEQLLNWRTGFVTFRDAALADAVAEFNRYSARKIVIRDPSIAAIKIGGNFRSTDTDAFLRLLQKGFPVAVEQRDDGVVLTRR